MSKHTKGPWRAEGALILAGQISVDCVTGDFEISVREDEANAARIVACVNACEGINPEAVQDMREALTAAEPIVVDYERKCREQYGPGAGFDEPTPALLKIRAAIRLAEGDQ